MSSSFPRYGGQNLPELCSKFSRIRLDPCPLSVRLSLTNLTGAFKSEFSTTGDINSIPLPPSLLCRFVELPD